MDYFSASAQMRKVRVVAKPVSKSEVRTGSRYSAQAADSQFLSENLAKGHAALHGEMFTPRAELNWKSSISLFLKLGYTCSDVT
jgi:hypothetical protein